MSTAAPPPPGDDDSRFPPGWDHELPPLSHQEERALDDLVKLLFEAMGEGYEVTEVFLRMEAIDPMVGRGSEILKEIEETAKNMRADVVLRVLWAVAEMSGEDAPQTAEDVGYLTPDASPPGEMQEIDASEAGSQVFNKALEERNRRLRLAVERLDASVRETSLAATVVACEAAFSAVQVGKSKFMAWSAAYWIVKQRYLQMFGRVCTDAELRREALDIVKRVVTTIIVSLLLGKSS
ncbi:MAG: hypothetical protein AAGB51_12970 [Planctomycetota bacterium]